MASSARTKISKLFNPFNHLRFALSRGPGSPSFSSSAGLAAESPPPPPPEALSGPRILGLDKEYEDYRRNLYGGLTHKALLVDAVGTLVIPSQPMAQVFFFDSSSLSFPWFLLFVEWIFCLNKIDDLGLCLCGTWSLV